MSGVKLTLCLSSSSADRAPTCAAHADGEQARKKTIVLATVIPAVATLLLAVGATIFAWRIRSERPTFRVSLSTLRQLNAASTMNLSFEVDNTNKPILLGKGAFGEVSS